MTVRNPCLDPRVGDKKTWTERIDIPRRTVTVVGVFPGSCWPVRVQYPCGGGRDMLAREWLERGVDNDAEWIAIDGGSDDKVA